MLVCIRYSYNTSFLFIFLLRGASRTLKFCVMVFEKSGPNVPCILTGKPKLRKINTGQPNSWAREMTSFSTRILCVSEIRAAQESLERGGGGASPLLRADSQSSQRAWEGDTDINPSSFN